MSVKNRCRGCRYAKCLEVGMRPELVDATLQRKNQDPRRKPPKKASGGLVTDNIFGALIQQQRKPGTENSPLDLSKAGGEGDASAVDDEDGETTTTQMFYVFNPPTQTYEPVTIISLGDEEGDGGGEEETPMEDTGRLVEEVLSEAERSILSSAAASSLPKAGEEEEEVVEMDKLFKEELVEAFHQDVEREEIVSDSGS